MKLAKRLSVIEPSMTLKVSGKAAELKARGVDVVTMALLGALLLVAALFADTV